MADDDRSSSGDEIDGHNEASDGDFSSASTEDSHGNVSVHSYSDNEGMLVDEVDAYVDSAHNVDGESEWGGIEEQELGEFASNSGKFMRTLFQLILLMNST